MFFIAYSTDEVKTTRPARPTTEFQQLSFTKSILL